MPTNTGHFIIKFAPWRGFLIAQWLVANEGG